MSQCEAAESSSQVTPQVIDGKERSSLDEVLRQGARQMLVQGWEAEVTAYIQAHQHEVDEDGRGWWCATATPASAPSSAARGSSRSRPRGSTIASR